MIYQLTILSVFTKISRITLECWIIECALKMVQGTETDCYQVCSMRSPCEKHLEIIKTELGENDERMRVAENLLYSWMSSQPHFPKNYDKMVVRNFLRGSKHNMERAKQKLEYHFKAKSYFPDIFTNRTVSEEIASVLKTVHMAPLSKLTKDGSRVFVLKISETDGDKLDFNLIPKAYFMIYDVLLRSPNSAARELAICDCEGVTATHLMKLAGILKSMISLLRQAYAMRLKELHFINTHSGIEKFMGILKPILHPKVRNSITFHHDSKSLLDHFGENVIPSNYGGKSESLEKLTEEWISILKENETWMKEQESVRISESVIVKQKNDGVCFKDQLGLDGCFRKLEID